MRHELSLALRLLVVRLDCSTTHSRKGQAELSQKTIPEVKKATRKPVRGSPTRAQTRPALAIGSLRYDFSF